MQRKGLAAVFRVIPARVKTAKELNLPPEVLQMVNAHKGLVCVTGPTGSGKSTTLAALIDHINETSHSHIVTIEDPIEFVHNNKLSLINQREVSSHTKSFANALKASLREDPDIILLGEMRDIETIALAITAAETGHLVFGTLHTSSAAKTVDRIIDVFPEERQAQVRVQLSESLRGVIAQSLLPRAGGNGRVAAFEIMMNNKAIANLIREGKTFQIPSVMQTSRNLGNISLESWVEHLLGQSVITRETAAVALGRSSEEQAKAESTAQARNAPPPPPPPSGAAGAIGAMANRFKKTS
jgi:twitching motility protein PilT